MGQCPACAAPTSAGHCCTGHAGRPAAEGGHSRDQEALCRARRLPPATTPAWRLPAWRRGDGSRRDRDRDLAVLDLDRVAGDAHLRVFDVLAGLDVIAVPVPGTDHDVALDSALAQGPSSVLAHVVDGVD